MGLFSLPVVERCLCVTVHTLVKQNNNNKRIFKNHRVSVLQAQTLLLLSTGTVVLSASVHSVVLKLWICLRLRCPYTAWSNSAPYCKTTGSFFIFLLPPASFIRYKELTHNPFIQTENRAARQLKEWCYIKSITVSTPFIRLLSHSSLGVWFLPRNWICCVILKSNSVCPRVRSCFNGFILCWHAFREGRAYLASFSDPWAPSSLQGTQHEASSSVYLQERQASVALRGEVWTCF